MNLFLTPFLFLPFVLSRFSLIQSIRFFGSLWIALFFNSTSHGCFFCSPFVNFAWLWHFFLACFLSFCLWTKSLAFVACDLFQQSSLVFFWTAWLVVFSGKCWLVFYFLFPTALEKCFELDSAFVKGWISKRLCSLSSWLDCCCCCCCLCPRSGLLPIASFLHSIHFYHILQWAVPCRIMLFFPAFSFFSSPHLVTSFVFDFLYLSWEGYWFILLMHDWRRGLLSVGLMWNGTMPIMYLLSVVLSPFLQRAAFSLGFTFVRVVFCCAVLFPRSEYLLSLSLCFLLSFSFAFALYCLSS